MARGFAGMLSASLIVASAAAQAPPDEVAAQAHFERGRLAFDRGDHEAALTSFESSYQLYPSPNTSLMMAYVLEQLGRRAAAAQAFDTTARQARLRSDDEPRYQGAAEAAEERLGELAPTLGVVVVELRGATGDARVRVGDRTVTREELGLPVFVEPGPVRVSVRAGDAPAVVRDIEVSAGREVRVALRVPAPRAAVTSEPGAPTADRSRREGGGNDALVAIGWTCAGLGVIGFAGVTVFGLLARNQFRELREACGGPCPPERADDVALGRTYQDLTNASVAVGSAFGAAAVVLLIVAAVEGGDVTVAWTPAGPGLGARF